MTKISYPRSKATCDKTRSINLSLPNPPKPLTLRTHRRSKLAMSVRRERWAPPRETRAVVSLGSEQNYTATQVGEHAARGSGNPLVLVI